MVCTFYHVTDVSYQEKYNKRMFMHHLLVSPLPHTGKTVQLPQSDLTPWTLTLAKTALKFKYEIEIG
jgi:hypothetical protein